MLKFENLKPALEAFRDKVVKESKQSLKRQKKTSSGRLFRSIKGSPVKVTDNSLEFNINMADYGTFVDKGVSGTERKFKTPYSYKDKMPPMSALDNWIVRKGIAPRDDKGRFIKRKSLQFLIARSIYKNGLKPTLFFTKPFRDNYKELPDILEKAFELDVENFIEFINKQNFK
jgi:hypothetical protein